MIKATINYLKEHDKIPNTGFFEITHNLVQDYILAYAILSERTTGIGKKSNIKFARRLAGLNLLKENLNRGASAKDIAAGHVYLISNPAFPMHYKIGMSIDCHKRLSNYQTYSPYRDFVLEKYDFVYDRVKTEKLLLNHPLLTKESGEWVLKDNAVLIFDDLASSQEIQEVGL